MEDGRWPVVGNYGMPFLSLLLIFPFFIVKLVNLPKVLNSISFNS